MNEEQPTPEQLKQIFESTRFVTLAAASMVDLIHSMNQYADRLGTLVYFGENKMLMSTMKGNLVVPSSVEVDLNHPFIAVFDSAPAFVATLEDKLENDTEMDIDTTLAGYKIVNSA